MGFGNPPVPWRTIEQTLSDSVHPDSVHPDSVHPDSVHRGNARDGGDPRRPEGADGGDSPAWSRKRSAYEAPALIRRPSRQRYAELHCHTSFSFLDGASSPEELVEEAARLDLSALAVTDHDGFYGVVRFAEAARDVGLPTVFGAELTIDKLDITPGQADPDGGHLLVLARDPVGYAALARVISEAQLAGEKGAPRMSMASLDRWLEPGEVDHWMVLTGCRKGAVPRALEREGPAAAERELHHLIDRFGRTNVAVELWDHGAPLDSVRNDAMVEIAMRAGVDVLATNNVHYAFPARRRLATAMAAVRSRRSLDEIEGWLPAASGAHLRSGDEQARRFARYPGVVERAAELGLACAFDLRLMAPKLPPFPCPSGIGGESISEMAYLRQLVEQAGVSRYGPRGDEYVPGAWAQLDHELDLIEHLDFPGYFLVVWDIVEFCRKAGILCQGRGSAANSAVCYVLGITKADAVSLGLLFERFLAPERDGPPDIDLDIESDRREEAIQYVYERHGRRHAAQVANVITYRAKSSVRDAAKALGYAPGQQDAFSKSLSGWSGLNDQDNELPDDVVELAVQFEDLPRHLGIHSGGMVMCDRPVIEVCPVEWGRMEGRTVLQWDKEDCAAAGLVKFDLLGLGMLSALHYSVDLIEAHHPETLDSLGMVDADGKPILDLAALEQDPAVYDMLCRADSIGVFQVESRAQMSTLPRLRPRTFYDLVVEIALIRPGPIQGGSVHPYIRRRNGQEPVTYLHPLLENSLEKTLGIPLFQEQLMQMAIDVSGFTPAEADELRRAMGSKRSRAKMERLKARLFDGMRERGITDDIGEEIWHKLVAFANYGFPESHSISFAYLVYASSWIKLHYPAAFCAALLNAQPMGFYSPHSLVQDARRHGVATLPPCVNRSGAGAVLERTAEGITPPPIATFGTTPSSEPDGSLQIERERWDHGWSVRMGIDSIRHLGAEVAAAVAANGPYESIEDVARRGCPERPLNVEQLEAMATAGAFDGLRATSSGPDSSGAARSGSSRRQDLWTAGAVVHGGDDKLAGIVTGMVAPQLPGMSEQEEAMADLWATGVAADGHPTRFLRDRLAEMGVIPADQLHLVEHATRVSVAGVVTHRQRPATASGVTFMSLEDETGLINVVISVGCWARYRRVARNAVALLVRGRCERQGAVVNIVAEKLEPLPVASGSMSRDFR
jgi:error-prone DNA polymerase